MTDRKADMNGKRALPELIRRQIGSEMNRRFLARLPAFKPAGGAMDRFEALLGEIDAAEMRVNGPRK